MSYRGQRWIYVPLLKITGQMGVKLEAMVQDEVKEEM